MVNHSDAALDATFGALADATRRALLTRLAAGETTVSRLAAPFAMSLPAVSKHLRVLERAGLVQRRRDGRLRRCRLETRPMRAAAAWIARHRRFWEAQLGQLARYLEDEAAHTPTPEPPTWPRTPFASGAPSRPRASESSGRGRRRRS